MTTGDTYRISYTPNADAQRHDLSPEQRVELAQGIEVLSKDPRPVQARLYADGVTYSLWITMRLNVEYVVSDARIEVVVIRVFGEADMQPLL